MLTKEEIFTLNVNPEVGRELLRQCEIRLDCVLETAEIFNQKAQNLFNVYFLVIAGITSLDAAVNATLVAEFKAAIGFLVAGITILAFSIYPLEYGRRGVNPVDWLNEKMLCATDAYYAQRLAVTALFYYQRIEISKRSNVWKLRILHAGMICGVLAMMAAVLTRI